MESRPSADVALQNKFVGTGHGDVSKHEWMGNVHRDSLASHVGHYSLLSYFAIAENESIARVRYNFLEKMARPVGVPPAKENVNNTNQQ